MAAQTVDADRVRAGLPPGTLWHEVRAVPTTGSTSADVADLARAGSGEGLVVLAAHQSSGRGRLGRTWTAPPGTSLALSVLLRPDRVPPDRWSWLTLLAGVATVDAVDDLAPGGAVRAALKWPNDVLVGDRKLAGILAERIDTPDGPAAVVGIGLNVTADPADLPEGATSLAAERVHTDLDEVATALLRRLGEAYPAWRDAGGDPEPGLADAYRLRCSTIGRPVRARLPGGSEVEGTATDLDRAGRLVLRTVPDGRVVTLGAGDVVHLR